MWLLKIQRCVLKNAAMIIHLFSEIILATRGNDLVQLNIKISRWQLPCNIFPYKIVKV